MLEEYMAILEGKKEAKYLKNMDKMEGLVKRAEEIYKECHLCEHRCGINRDERKGICNVGKASIATHFMHYGEEEVLVPSYTIFFSGCNFKCVYCQNWDISQRMAGIYIEPEKMAYIINGVYGIARNINWVGGEPTPNLPYIIEVLQKCSSNIPQIWNSNMYCSLETMKLLNGVIDLYLTDFKYGNDKCAERLSNVKRYLEVVERNHLIAYEQGDLLIRHLVMPNHIECCTKYILRWISKNTPNSIVNVMEQYRPEYKAHEYEDISRPLRISEYEEALKIAKDLGLNVI